jgi:hypothetical protein
MAGVSVEHFYAGQTFLEQTSVTRTSAQRTFVVQILVQPS